jgi:hypothetical protein
MAGPVITLAASCRLRSKAACLALRESNLVVIIGAVPQLPALRLTAITGKSAKVGAAYDSQPSGSGAAKRGQVAQVVERSPEKAGVGGSTPSLATTFQST